MQDKAKILVQLFLVLPNSLDHYLNACLILMSPISSQEFHKVYMKTPVTARKVFKVFSGLYFPVFGLNADQEKPSIWTLFTQCVSVSFLRVTDPKPETLLKKKLRQRYFPVNFAKFSRTHFFI